ncbi:GSCOCG00012070001-RA-CDS, partial [Cotesia congregata]
MLMENPEDGVDQIQLMKYIWDAGKIMADVFHQHSTARKSFITPNLDKDIKSTLEATVSDEWLYGQKLTDQVKDAKNIKKASTSLKAPEKSTTKKTTTFSSGRETIREAFLIKGVPEDSVDFMVNSITPSTLKQYEGCLKRWTQFATEKKFNVFDPSTANIIEFLTKRFNENVGYGTLNSTRSAISLIVKRDLSKDDLISR